MRAAWAGVEARPAPRARPANPASKAAAAARTEGHQRKAVRSSVIVDPWARPAPAVPEVCSVRLGTQPWAEVWIDGKNTRGHTPYLNNISCGVHTVTFKRPDLERSKTHTITVKPGEPFRQSFPFE